MQVFTLLSDQGLMDIKLPVLKAHLTEVAPEAQIIDIAHDPSLRDLWKMAYLLSSAAHYFPAETIHIVQNEHGGPNNYVAVRIAPYWFIAPDNGLLPFALEQGATEGVLIYQTPGYSDPVAVSQAIIAAVRAIVTQGQPAQQPATTLQQGPRIAPARITGNRIDCNILAADNFGNLILNLTKAQFEAHIGDRAFKLKLPGVEDLSVISNHYNEVGEGQFLCRFNSSGYLEVAVNRGKAVEKFQSGSAVSRSIHYLYISIEFDSTH